MLFYELPKDKLTYGPNQISAMIDQSTTISEQLTLWDQKGSGVIRGKLVVIPIENSFLYIVPLYLQAEGTNFPQLKRVIAATGDKVVLRATLDDALAGLLGAQETPQINGVSQPGSQVGATQVPATQTGTEVEQERAQLAAAQKAIDSLKLLLNSAPTGLTLVTRNVAVGCAHQLCQIYRTIIGVPLCKLPPFPIPTFCTLNSPYYQQLPQPPPESLTLPMRLSYRRRIMKIRDQLLKSTAALLFFLDDGGTPFASIPRGLTESCVPLHSPELRTYLFGEYEKAYSAVPNIYAYRDLLHVLEAKANDSAVPRRSLDPRIAADGPRFHPETIYLNLANESGDAVEISARGWNVRPAKPFYFRASTDSRELPAPAADGPALDSLFETLTGLPVELRQPCLDWMLAALRPTGPYPILVLKGPTGSGKSTLGRLLRQTLDPSRDPLPTLPNTARRLRAHAEKNRIVAFDHVTHISRKLSEVLCTIAKPIVLTMPDRSKLDPELTSRATVVELPEIQPEQRRTEAELFTTFHQLHAQILTRLCLRPTRCTFTDLGYHG